MRKQDLTKSRLFKKLAKDLAQTFNTTEEKAMSFLDKHADEVWESSKGYTPGITNSFPTALKDFWRANATAISRM